MANDKWLDDEDMDDWQNLGNVAIPKSDPLLLDNVPITDTTAHFIGESDLLEDSLSKGTFANGGNGTHRQSAPNQQQRDSGRRMRAKDALASALKSAENYLDVLDDQLSDNETVATTRSRLTAISTKTSQTNQTSASVRQGVGKVKSLLQNFMAT